MRFLIFFMVLLVPDLYAQQQSIFKLDQAVAYALENQVSIKNAMLDTEISRAKVGEVRALGLPQINGSAKFVDNPKLQYMFFEYGTNPFLPTYIPGKDTGDVLYLENLFQLRSSGDISLSINQLLFDGSYFVGLKAASTYKELAKYSLENTKVNTVEAVSKAFYLVLVNRERMTLIDANISRLDTVLKQTQILNKEGFVEKIDVDRLEVNFNNLITEKSKFENLLQVSELLLKFQMGYPINEPISIEGDISAFTVDSILREEIVNYDSRPDYRVLRTTKELQELNLKKERMSSLPTLSAFANGGYFSQHTSYWEMFGNSYWFPYAMVGLNLSVPILDGFGKVYRAKQAKLEIEKAENNLLNFENVVNFQVQQSKFNYQNSLKSLQAQKRNLELAEEVTRISKIKYQEGVGSNLELVTAETSYKEAQTNYYNALYDVIVSKIDYEKSLGTLYSE